MQSCSMLSTEASADRTNGRVELGLAEASWSTRVWRRLSWWRALASGAWPDMMATTSSESV